MMPKPKLWVLLYRQSPPLSPVPSPFQPRPSASLVSPRGMPWPHPAVPSPTLPLAGWCPLSPTGAQTTQLLVEPPWRPAALWDRVTLTCQGSGTAGATTWYKDGQRWWQEGPDRLTVTENGTYECNRTGTGLSLPMRVLDDWLVLQVPARPLLEGDRVTLRCRDRWNNLVTWVSFYREEKQLVELRNGTELTLFPLQPHHSGRYHCRGWLKDRQWVVSAPVTVTVHVPVANATITPCPLAHEVRAGDNVTLRCSVQVGSAPVTFTWLHNGQEVAQSPLLELRDIDVGHSGTYQCVATNQLGQDGHHVFQAPSPELVLEVTPWGQRVIVAAGVGGALLFLLVLVGAIVAWHWWHRVAARKQQERAPPDPTAPPKAGRVPYTHVVSSKQARWSPNVTVPQDPQETYVELWGSQGQPWEPGDIYGNVL
ncbi:high affinity immunoglobulin gamma Fc receptor I-like [Zonotrichia albicollis]|uniref:high affinity immunoglobulin gamma Fc receptor I-like n=1 Tax=Zonotrichia albicollis TaxID=44394 RepID=UPI003D80DA60